jgi:hypothetical protein
MLYAKLQILSIISQLDATGTKFHGTAVQLLIANSVAELSIYVRFRLQLVKKFGYGSGSNLDYFLTYLKKNSQIFIVF